MHKKYLGDSYDLVKRFWSQSLDTIAPLYAHSRFVPASIRSQYTAVTTIPILDQRPDVPFGILLDPDTGIPLPTEVRNGATASHASLQFAVDLTEKLQPNYMICFDQSYYRKHDLDRAKQRKVKMLFLRDRNISAFYYVSHAPFLFMAGNQQILDSIFERLVSLGIPEGCFQFCDVPSTGIE